MYEQGQTVDTGESESARVINQEYVDDTPGRKVALFDMHNAKFARRSGGLKEVAVCSLFTATDITVRWEPDVHLAFCELVLHVKVST